MEKLTERCHLTRDGVTLYDLQQAAENIGLRTLAIRCTVEELVERIPLPAIVLWTNNHYIVVDEADDSRIHVLDPARGSVWYSHEEFQRGWYQEDKQTGVLMAVEPRTSKETNEDTQLHKSMTMQYDDVKISTSGVSNIRSRLVEKVMHLTASPKAWD